MKVISVTKPSIGLSELFNDTSRITRNVNIIIAKSGRKALSKANLHTAFFDAMISVVEAFDAYIEYKTVCEQTKQLELELKSIKKYFYTQKKIFSELLETEKKEIELSQQKIISDISVRREQQQILLKINEEATKHLNFLKQKILEEKKTYIYDDRIRNLETKYLEALKEKIKLTYQLLGG